MTGLGASGFGDPGIDDLEDERPKRGGQLYDLTGVIRERGKAERPLVDKPELLTVEAVDALAELGIEVDFQVRGKVMTLVPAYTGQDRPELSYRDARTLVLVMQVFPGATVDSLRMPETENVS